MATNGHGKGPGHGYWNTNGAQTRALSIVNKMFPHVTRVVDAKSGLTLEVMAQDARPRGRKKHQACAVAQACTRQFGLDGAVIAMSRAYLVKGTTAMRYDVPTAVSRELVSFDRGSEFQPGVYRLGPIPKYARMGQYAKRQNKTKTGRGKKKGPVHAWKRTQGVRASLVNHA